MLRITSIVLSGGSGTRMGTAIKKQYLTVKGKELLIYSLEAMEENKKISEIILVVPIADIEFCEKLMKKYNLKKIIAVVTGGETRFASVYNGLQAVPKNSDLVVVHDGARPLLSQTTLEDTIQAGKIYGAAIAAIPVKDTIKQIDDDSFIDFTYDRDVLWAAQTPQVFRRDIIMDCYQKAFESNLQGTDDASIIERFGYKVRLVMGDYENIKITTPGDFEYAQFLLCKEEGE